MIETLHGHAIHFLERLERASGAASELALELYNHPQILRFVLQRIRISEGRDRVAVSLDSEDRGPFLVATAAGAFVTCLGRDMAPRDLHVVPHGQLTAHRRDWWEMQTRLRQMDELRSADKRFDTFVGEFVERGNQVCREEFIAASALQIVLKREFAYYLVEFQAQAVNLLEPLIYTRALNKQKDSTLRSLWRAHWSLGHLALLTTMDGPRDFDENFARLVTISLLQMFRWGETSLCMRALWGLARMGKAALPHCKEQLRCAAVEMDWLGAVLGIAIIGMRHRKLAAQTLKNLESPAPVASPDNSAAEYYRLVGDKVMDYIRSVISNPEELDAACLRQARWATADIARQVKAGPPYQFANEAEVPEDLARSVWASWEGDVRFDKECVAQLAAPLSWLARCEAEDLYVPRSWGDLVHTRWTRDRSIALIEHGRAYWGKPEPIKATPKPARNEPCPCGSGKKYKKCCLGAA